MENEMRIKRRMEREVRSGSSGTGKTLRIKTSIARFSEKTRPERKLDLHAQVLGDECILYDSNGDKVYSLNATAAFVWGLCDGRHTLDRIIEQTAKAFGGSDIALVEEDVKELLGELSSLELVTLRVPLKLK